jgi:hypothetical protein
MGLRLWSVLTLSAGTASFNKKRDRRRENWCHHLDEISALTQ